MSLFPGSTKGTKEYLEWIRKQKKKEEENSIGGVTKLINQYMETVQQQRKIKNKLINISENLNLSDIIREGAKQAIKNM